MSLRHNENMETVIYSWIIIIAYIVIYKIGEHYGTKKEAKWIKENLSGRSDGSILDIVYNRYKLIPPKCPTSNSPVYVISNVDMDRIRAGYNVDGIPIEICDIIRKRNKNTPTPII